MIVLRVSYLVLKVAIVDGGLSFAAPSPSLKESVRENMKTDIPLVLAYYCTVAWAHAPITKDACAYDNYVPRT